MALMILIGWIVAKQQLPPILQQQYNAIRDYPSVRDTIATLPKNVIETYNFLDAKYSSIAKPVVLAKHSENQREWDRKQVVAASMVWLSFTAYMLRKNDGVTDSATSGYLNALFKGIDITASRLSTDPSSDASVLRVYIARVRLYLMQQYGQMTITRS